MKKPSRLKAGLSVMDITPPLGYRLFGHSARKGLSDAVHDPLRLKVLTLFDGHTRLVIVTSDLIDFSSASVQNVRRTARERLGIRSDHLLLTSSHTHTGPCMSMNTTLMPAEHILPDYIGVVEKKIVGGIREAMGAEAPATLHWGEDRLNIGVINRRFWDGKEIQFRPNPRGPVDDQLNVLRVGASDGTPRAVLFRYSCHPTVLDSALHQVSADYPGAAQAAVERAFPCAAALFLQGCCGDVRPAIIRGNEFAGGSFEDVERMGRRLGTAVVRVCKTACPLLETRLAGRADVIRLPVARELQPASLKRLRELAEKYARENREFAEMGYVAAWEKAWQQRLRDGAPLTSHVPMPVHLLRIGEATLAGLAAEVMAEYGEWIRQTLGPRTLVAGYADGDMGYLPTAEALSQGGYEAVYHLFENYSAPFAPALQQKALRGLSALKERCA